MSKYNIDKSFHIISNFNVHLNKQVIFWGNKILKNSVKCLRHNNDIIVKKEKVNAENGMIDIHIIMPQNCAEKNPCLFYIHGGGFAFALQPHQYKNVANYAVKTGSIIVLPHYRLTPKASSPTLFNDCLTAWQWTLANADKYKIDPMKIGVGGDSAGGYLASRLTNFVVKNCGNIKYQLLIYPVIDSAMRTESMKKYTNTPMWNAKNNKIMWQWYYNNKEKQETSLLDDTLPLGLPPTYIETAEFDCLHDEGLLYADKLKKAKVDVTTYQTHKTMHGFDCVKCEITEKAILSRVNFINKQIK